jgi:hypothetical protein
MFLAAGIDSAGSARNVELLTVYRSLQEWDANQENTHYLLDCDTMNIKLNGAQRFTASKKDTLPPPLIRITDNLISEPGTLEHRAFEIACGKQPLPQKTNVLPVNLMKTKWGRLTRPR